MLKYLFMSKIECCCCFYMFFWYCYKSIMECFGKISIVDKIESDNISDYWIDINLFDVYCFCYCV